MNHHQKNINVVKIKSNNFSFQYYIPQINFTCPKLSSINDAQNTLLSQNYCKPKTMVATTTKLETLFRKEKI